MKRFISLLLVFTMVLPAIAGIPFSVSAADEEPVIIFTENFEAGDVTYPMALATSTTAGYNSWVLENNNYQNAYDQGTKFEIIEDGADNKALYCQRESYISLPSSDPNYVYYEQMPVMRTLPTVPETDTVTVSWKMKYDSNIHYLAWRGVLSEIRHDRITTAGGNRFEPTAEQTSLFTGTESWHNYELIINYTAGTTSIKIDDTLIGTPANETIAITKLDFFVPNNHWAALGNVMVDDIVITHIPDPEYITFTDISNGQTIDNVTANLNLIESKGDYSFTWESSNPAVIAIDGTSGTVIRPTDNDAFVTLTATVKHTASGKELVKTKFIVTVPANTTGQTVLFYENFDATEGTLPQALSTAPTSGYNSWHLERDNYTLAKSEGTEFNIIAESSANNVLNVLRTNYISKANTDPDYVYYEQVIAMRTLPAIRMKDSVKLSWRMKSEKSSHYIAMRGLLNEIRHDRVTLGNGTQFVPDADTTPLLTNNTDWMTYELLINYTAGTSTLKVNGQQIGAVASYTPELKSIELFSPNNHWAAIGNVYIDDIKIIHIPDPEWVTFEDISNGQKIDNVTENLDFINTKDIYSIKWISSNTDIISENGVVTRPKLKDEIVTLTAKITLTSNEAEVGDAEFIVTVPSDGTIIWSEGFDEAALGTHLVETTNLGYNGWKLDARSAVSNGISTLERAICEDTLLQILKDPDDETNQALHMRRKLNVSYDRSPYDGGDPTNWIATKQLENSTPINSGVVYLSGRLWLNASGGRIWFEPFGAIRSDKWVTASNNYFNSGAEYVYTAEEAALWKIQEWNTFGFLMNFDDHWTQMYVNGQPVGPQVFMTLTEFKDMSLYMPRNETGGEHYIDSISLKQANLTDLEWVDMALKDVVLDLDPAGITEPIILPETSTYGTTISWSSSNTDIIADDGAVARPRGDNQTVTLTATVSKNGISNTKDFEVVVKGYSEIEYISATFDFNLIGNGQKEWYVTDDLSLINSYEGASVTWESRNTDVLTHNGKVTRSDVDVPVVFSATFDVGGNIFTRDFNLVIAGEGTILAEEDFSSTSTEGQNISGWHGWKLEEPNKDASVNAIIRKNVSDTLKSYEDAEKVLSLKRYLTAAEASVSNQKVMFGFNSIKPEIMRIDFDFMFKSPNTVLYVELNGMNRHYAISQKGIGLKARDVVPFGSELSANKWYHATIELDTYTNEYNLYLDYEKINDEPIYEPGSAYVDSINFYSNCVTATTHEEFLIRRIMVRDTAPDESDAVANAVDSLTLSEIDYSTCRLALPKYGEDNTRIVWASSAPESISEDGVVTRGSNQKTVTMTATVSKGSASAEKEIPVTVLPHSPFEPTTEILEVIASQLTEESITDEKRFRITKNLNLPKEITNGRAADIGGVDIKWESSYPSVITDDGIIFPQQYEVATILTATITAKTNPNISVTKDLKFAVEVGGEIYHDFYFDDMDVKNAGATISDWSGMELREREGGTEYGTQVFADKAPDTRYMAYDDANEAMFLNRYTTAKYDSITALSHATIKKFSGYYYGDVMTLSFRIQFQTPADKLKTEVYCQQQRNIYVSPTSITMSQNTMEYVFPEPLALGEWHDITFYYDMKSWRLDVYCNGEYLLSEPIVFGTGPYPYLNQWRFYNDGLGYLVLDDIRVRNIKLPDASQIVEDAMAKTTIPPTAKADINLPSYMGTCAVTWRSSDESVISDGGRINPSANQSKSATLTATFRYNDVVKKKEFKINVPAQPDYNKYEISDINVSGNTVSSVRLSKKSAGAESGKLVVAVYDCDEFKSICTYDISDMTSGSATTISTNIDTGDTVNLKVKAFVVSSADNKIISNSHFYKEGE